MDQPGLRCLIVAPDFTAAARLSERASEAHDLRVVMAPGIEAARRLLDGARFDIVIADARYEEDVLALRQFDSAGDPATEFFLTGREFTKEQIVDALRHGVRDVFEEPIVVEHVVEALGRAVSRIERSRRDFRRQHRLRELSSRIIKDRREVRRRVDVVCKDLVSAYRQLAQKVVALEHDRPE